MVRIKKKKVTKKVVNKAIDYRWWDYSYMLAIEQACLKDMAAKYLSIGSNATAYNDAKWMNICVKLIDIITNRDSALEFNKISGKSIKLGHFTMPYGEFKCTKYINCRNALRFYKNWDNLHVDNLQPSNKASFLDDLRIQKAWKLYHKIREYFMQGWWD